MRSTQTAFPFRVATRQKYAFYAPDFSDFDLARELAAKINATRDLENQPQRAVKSGRLAAAALLDEIFAHIIALYVEEVEPEALEDVPSFCDENLGPVNVQTLLALVESEYASPLPLTTRPQQVEYAWRLGLANLNPAMQLFAEVFDDTPLQNSAYPRFLPTLEAYFAALPPFGPENLSLFDVLMSPIRAHPDSLEAQLRYVLARGGHLIEPFATRLLVHLDLIREEEKPMFFGPGPSEVPDYKGGLGGGGSMGGALELNEYEAFTPDRDWMPKVVLIAKQTYVWLDQLSKKYGHTITRFDQIPDAELDELATRGISGLWMIGLWQRSKASKNIKHMTGNPDAIASAYSLYSYDIAEELGGVEGLNDLKARAANRGIRLASDMVPNHMAIDSQWVMDHPDWFLGLDYPPFPNSSFDGPDLSDNPAVGIFIEHGYYDKSDASVVFRRLDRQTGENRYIYHGNDGTLTPWNDTAQLDYLKPEVREAVIQTILAVARQFPIIRFDAAMTLAKRHIHRLWFPSPGEGGDIPSRAGKGLTPAEFDALMPHEFWREVVDRAAVEAPDTLLLAEAFWMLEGYFVRTLGMHRVYNSAFMVMLRDEENEKYRLLLKNTLEFDIEILGRFVNFLNNPDEKTASEQFGKGDKYFGVCTVMATMPGLPMFGHGQWEGYEEKYGMEYPRAYWNETPDKGFMAHHEAIITPLLKKRSLFAGSTFFRLYDFWKNDGWVNEDVLVYSNAFGDERALIIYNNSERPTGGWVRLSSAFALKKGDGQTELRQITLGEALDLKGGSKSWVVFRDNTTKFEFLRRADDLKSNGLYVELGAYGCHSFLDWREVRDEHGWYESLATRLEGRGVPSVARAIQEMLVEPLLQPFSTLCDAPLWKSLLNDEDGSVAELESRLYAFAGVVSAFLQRNVNAQAYVENTLQLVNRAKALEVEPDEPETEEPIAEISEAGVEPTVEATPEPVAEVPAAKADAVTEAETEDEEDATEEEETEVVVAKPARFDKRAIWLGYALLAEVGRLGDNPNIREQSVAYTREWLLSERVEQTWGELGLANPGDSIPLLKLALLASSHAEDKPLAFLAALLAEDDAQWLLGINNFSGVMWYRGEGAETLLDFLEQARTVEGANWPIEILRTASEEAEFRVVKWMDNVQKA